MRKKMAESSQQTMLIQKTEILQMLMKQLVLLLLVEVESHF